MISTDAMKKMVISYAAAGVTGYTPTVIKSGVKKADPDEGRKRAQRLLITWISEEKDLLSKISKYIDAGDFTTDLYKKIASRLFEEIENDGDLEPASLISMFEDEEEQKEVASLFNTRLTDLNGQPLEIDSVRDKERALYDILINVKTGSLEYYTKRLGSEPDAIKRVMEGKKLLEDLKKNKIKLG